MERDGEKKILGALNIAPFNHRRHRVADLPARRMLTQRNFSGHGRIRQARHAGGKI